MLKILLRKQFSEIFRNYFYDAKKNKKRSKGAVIAYIALFVLIMAGVLGGMFALFSFAICGEMVAAGMDWLFFVVMGMLAILLGTFGSVFNTYSTLYLAKDNDLLLSLPIPVSTVMAARLLSVYLMGLMYSAVVIGPAVIVYWIIAPFTVARVIGSILLMALISVFVLTLSCALGWVVAKATLKLKHKSFITVFISLIFFAVYYVFCFQAQNVIEELAVNAAFYGTKVKSAAYILYLFGCVGTGDWKACLIITALVLALFGLMWYLISRSFLKIATSSGYAEKVKYKETVVKQKSVSGALFAKEMRRFTSSPNYMLNCGLGIILLPVAGIVLLIKGETLTLAMSSMPELPQGSLAIFICSIVCMVAAMNDMTAPSVSLEAKNLWLMQSLPVSPWQVLRAKLNLQLVLTAIPVLFCGICGAVIIPDHLLNRVLTVLLALLYALFSALFGLFMGLKMPNLTWTNEVTPIKQSGGVTLALFGGWFYAIVLAGGYFLGGWHLGLTLYLVVFAVITAVLCGVLYHWLKHKGNAVFAALSV